MPVGEKSEDEQKLGSSGYDKKLEEEE